MSTLFEVRTIVKLRDEFMEDWSRVVYDHFTYAIVVMYDLEIIDACLLLITTWLKIDAFLQNKLNAMT